MSNNTLSFTANYKDSEMKRQYSIDITDETSSNPNAIKAKVIAINASLAGGTANELANLFVSDDYNSSQNIGTLQKITDVKIKSVIETPIN